MKCLNYKDELLLVIILKDWEINFPSIDNLLKFIWSLCQNQFSSNNRSIWLCWNIKCLRNKWYYWIAYMKRETLKSFFIHDPLKNHACVHLSLLFCIHLFPGLTDFSNTLKRNILKLKLKKISTHCVFWKFFPIFFCT